MYNSVYPRRRDLLKLNLQQQAAGAEPEAAVEPEAEPEAEPQSEPEAEPQSEPEAEPQSEPEAVPEVEPEAVPEAEADRGRIGLLRWSGRVKNRRIKSLKDQLKAAQRPPEPEPEVDAEAEPEAAAQPESEAMLAKFIERASALKNRGGGTAVQNVLSQYVNAERANTKAKILFANLSERAQNLTEVLGEMVTATPSYGSVNSLRNALEAALKNVALTKAMVDAGMQTNVPAQALNTAALRAQYQALQANFAQQKSRANELIANGNALGNRMVALEEELSSRIGSDDTFDELIARLASENKPIEASMANVQELSAELATFKGELNAIQVKKNEEAAAAEQAAADAAAAEKLAENKDRILANYEAMKPLLDANIDIAGRSTTINVAGLEALKAELDRLLDPPSDWLNEALREGKNGREKLRDIEERRSVLLGKAIKLMVWNFVQSANLDDYKAEKSKSYPLVAHYAFQTQPTRIGVDGQARVDMSRLQDFTALSGSLEKYGQRDQMYNVMLMGPSGSGKTSLYESLVDKIKVAAIVPQFTFAKYSEGQVVKAALMVSDKWETLTTAEFDQKYIRKTPLNDQSSRAHLYVDHGAMRYFDMAGSEDTRLLMKKINKLGSGSAAAPSPYKGGDLLSNILLKVGETLEDKPYTSEELANAVIKELHTKRRTPLGAVTYQFAMFLKATFKKNEWPFMYDKTEQSAGSAGVFVDKKVQDIVEELLNDPGENVLKSLRDNYRVVFDSLYIARSNKRLNEYASGSEWKKSEKVDIMVNNGNLKIAGYERGTFTYIVSAPNLEKCMRMDDGAISLVVGVSREDANEFISMFLGEDQNPSQDQNPSLVARLGRGVQEGLQAGVRAVGRRVRGRGATETVTPIRGTTLEVSLEGR